MVQKKTLRALDEINLFIKDSEVKEIAGFLFPPETLAEMKNPETNFNTYMQSLIKLYGSLAEAAEICPDEFKN
jgi:hypothetical protein